MLGRQIWLLQRCCISHNRVGARTPVRCPRDGAREAAAGAPSLLKERLRIWTYLRRSRRHRTHEGVPCRRRSPLPLLRSPHPLRIHRLRRTRHHRHTLPRRRRSLRLRSHRHRTRACRATSRRAGGDRRSRIRPFFERVMDRWGGVRGGGGRRGKLGGDDCCESFRCKDICCKPRRALCCVVSLNESCVAGASIVILFVHARERCTRAHPPRAPAYTL